MLNIPTATLETHDTEKLGAQLVPLKSECLPHDLREWIELCESGNLYDAIAQLFGLDPGERNAVKKFLFRVVLSGATPRPTNKNFSMYLEFPTAPAHTRPVSPPNEGVESSSGESQGSVSPLAPRQVRQGTAPPDRTTCGILAHAVGGGGSTATRAPSGAARNLPRFYAHDKALPVTC